MLACGDLPCWLTQPATAILAEISLPLHPPPLDSRGVSVLLLHTVSYSQRSLCLPRATWHQRCGGSVVSAATVMSATCSQRSWVSYQTKRLAVPGGALELSSASAAQFQTQIGCGMKGRGQSLFAFMFHTSSS